MADQGNSNTAATMSESEGKTSTYTASVETTQSQVDEAMPELPSHSKSTTGSSEDWKLDCQRRQESSEAATVSHKRPTESSETTTAASATKNISTDPKRKGLAKRVGKQRKGVAKSASGTTGIQRASSSARSQGRRSRKVTDLAKNPFIDFR